MEATIATIHYTTTPTEDVALPTAREIAIQSALAALRAGDPDAVPTVRLRAAYRECNCKQNGAQTYRRVQYPGESTHHWPDSDRLPRIDSIGRAATRNCSVSMEVPIGTIVLDYESALSRGRASKASLTIGLVIGVVDGKGTIEWLTHRTLRARPVYEVTLPDGSKIEIDRNDR